MEEKKDTKKIYDYKPSNPNDPKMPSLEITKEFDFNNSLTKTDSYLEENTNSDLNQANNSGDSQEVLFEGLEDSKQNAANVILKIKSSKVDLKNLKQAENEKQETLTNEFTIPDPTSELSIFRLLANKKNTALKSLNKAKDIIKSSRSEVRMKLTEKEIKKLLETFKNKVIKITQKEVLIKNSKYGFEIYRNSSDKRYWVAALCFEEIWDPKKSHYVNLWSGNTFTGYGFSNFEELIQQVKTMMQSGKTGNITWRDYVIGWDKQKNRFYAGDEPKQFTYSEYKKIVKWYKENKIWILVKQVKVKDIEDLMEEDKQKRKTGEPISAVSAIQAKLLDRPRRASLIFGYPVKDPNYKGKDFANPENKLYEIGFAFTE